MSLQEKLVPAHHSGDAPAQELKLAREWPDPPAASPVTGGQLSPEFPIDTALILATFLVKVRGYGSVVGTQAAPKQALYPRQLNRPKPKPFSHSVSSGSGRSSCQLLSAGLKTSKCFVFSLGPHSFSRNPFVESAGRE